MHSKLTLRLEKTLIDNAKKYAHAEGKSVSRIVSDYFRAIPASQVKTRLGPITGKLYGCLKGSPVSEDDYRRHLERKYL